jgi:hypothetical protein
MSYGTQPMPLAARNPVQTGHGMVGKPAVGGGAPGLPERDGATLDLDFTKGVLDPRITFTRASAGTRVSSNGLIQSMPMNVPRFDHDPITCKPLGLLIEEQRTNLTIYSSDLTNAQWTFTDNTPSADSTIAPNNNTGTYKLTEGNAGTALVVNYCSVASTGTYTSSIFAKYSNQRWVRLIYATSGLTNGGQVWFDIQNGVLGTIANRGTGTGTTASIQNYGGGWYRLAVTSTNATAGTDGSCAICSASADNSTTRTSGAIYYLWGSQVEAGAFPTSYIPTTSAAVVRYADVATMTGNRFGTLFGRTEGTILAQGKRTSVSMAAVIAQVDDGSENNRMSLGTDASANPTFQVTTGNSSQATIDAGTMVANTEFKFAGSYRADRFSASFNGGTAVNDTSGTVPVPSVLRLGANSLAPGWSGTLKMIKYWPFSKTAQQLKKLTA